jgi:hypothetical protein
MYIRALSDRASARNFPKIRDLSPSSRPGAHSISDKTSRVIETGSQSLVQADTFPLTRILDLDEH